MVRRTASRTARAVASGVDPIWILDLGLWTVSPDTAADQLVPITGFISAKAQALLAYLAITHMVPAERAVDPNQMYLAEALIADERYPDAEAAIQTTRKLLADSKWDKRRAAWKDALSKIERKLRAKQG